MYSRPNPRVQRTRRGVKRIAGGAVLVLVACRQPVPSDPPGAERVLTPFPYRQPVDVKDYIGHVGFGFEHRIFVPCGADAKEAWWLETADRSISRKLKGLVGSECCSSSSSPGVVLFAHVRGRLYGPGDFGHLDQYRRELWLDEVLEARPHLNTDCALPAQ
jgi:hypothetical protein